MFHPDLIPAMSSSQSFTALIAASFLCFDPVSAAGPQGAMVNPDFTMGGTIPEGANHDWNLGATGLRGWMFSEKMSTAVARQIKVTEVAKDSPAERVFEVGDVILGAGGEPFSHDPRTEFGRALTAAETETGGGRLALTRWRDGTTEQVELKLPVLGSYSATAPFDCLKSKRILDAGCEALAKRMAEEDYPRGLSPITRSFNALALLASGDRKYLRLVRAEAKWAADFTAGGNQPWWYSGNLMLLSEYIMATGDKSVLPGLRRMALETANGASFVGSWGHGFVGQDGRLGGYGMMNSTGVPLTIGLVMARAAGVSDPQVSRVIELSANLLRFYAGKGAVPYGDHHPWTETHEDNGKSGKTAVLFNLLNEPQTAGFFARMSLASHGNERDGGHTGNFFNIAWAMPAIALSGPHATGAWMEEFGAWYFDLARRWDGRFTHQGPPDKSNDSYHNWDATGVYLLAYAMPLKAIWLTGKKPAAIPPLDAETARQVVMDGRGWTDRDRHSAYDALNIEQLFDGLGSWSPVVRERAAMALARRGDAPVDGLVKLLGSPSLDARLGACEALVRLRGRAAPAVPALRAALKAEDLWLRVKAAEALANIGPPAMEAVPELLTLLAKGPTKEDPRNMQQRFLCFAVFGQMLRNSLDGVDRDLLRKAVLGGLQNQDGRARGAIGSVYQQLTYEEVRPLLPAIYEAIITPAPSGEMFANEIIVAGLDLLAKHHIQEGMAACVNYIRSQNRWASEHRTPEVLKILLRYGAHARSVVPELEKVARYFDQGEPDFPRPLSKQKAAAVREAIESINATQDRPSLNRIRP